MRPAETGLQTGAAVTGLAMTAMDGWERKSAACCLSQRWVLPASRGVVAVRQELEVLLLHVTHLEGNVGYHSIQVSWHILEMVAGLRHQHIRGECSNWGSGCLTKHIVDLAINTRIDEIAVLYAQTVMCHIVEAQALYLAHLGLLPLLHNPGLYAVTR